jgi:transcriptional regulator with XRE-family HTH domain
LTQADLAARSGVPLGTRKRFERLGAVSLSSLLAVAEALDALDELHALFPRPEARTLDEVEAQASLVKRARPRARRRVGAGLRARDAGVGSES